MTDARIEEQFCERYPKGLPVTFRVDGSGVRGILTKLTTAGGFIASKAFPSPADKVRVGVALQSGQPPGWLEMQVNYVNDEPTDNMPIQGFGGQWLRAFSQVAEDHLTTFLVELYGVEDPIVQVVGRGDGKPVYIYQFAAPVQNEPAALEQDESAAPGQDESEREELPEVPQDGRKDSGSRWSSFVQKLSGVRSRSRTPVRVDFSDHDFVLTYRVGKLEYGARAVRMSSAALVLESREEPPELWTRLYFRISVSKKESIEVQATLTRVKSVEEELTTAQVLQNTEAAVIHTLHCKISKVVEKGLVGTFRQFVEAFNQRQQELEDEDS